MISTTIGASSPIGIFDSGIGGLTVARALADALPNEQLIYIGDTAHLPYGQKSEAAILSYAKSITQYLYDSGCKLVVIACNTASAAAYEALQELWAGKMLIVDVITPLVEDIARRGFAKVGVIATKATVRSDIYARKLLALQPEIEVASLATSLLAQMIEEGFFNNQISESVLAQYLSYPDFEDIQALLLACTHYPLIRKEITSYFGGRVQVFDSVDTVVEKVKKMLTQHNLLQTNPYINSEKAAQYQFLVSDYTQAFQQTTAIFYQKHIPLQLLTWRGDVLVLE
jgi:glutamate racemase